MFLSLWHGRLAKVQFRSQRAKVQRADLRVSRCASARACDRRSFHHTWDSCCEPPTPVAAEWGRHGSMLCCVSNKMGTDFVFFFFVCSLDRTVLLSFSPVWNQQCLLACGQMRTRRIFLYTHVCVTRGTPTHTANTHHVGDVVVSFFSFIDHWVSADRSVNRRRRGSRSLRRPRSPNSWRHDNNTLRYHCALCGPAAIMASRRFWDSSSNVV